MRWSIEFRDRLYIKDSGFLPFSKNTDKKLDNNYGQKHLKSAKISTTNAIKTVSKRAIQKTTNITLLIKLQKH